MQDEPAPHGDRADPFRRDRFAAAQAASYENALREVRAGARTSRWMWYVCPQIAGLGRSQAARHRAIGSLAEARALELHLEDREVAREAGLGWHAGPPLGASGDFGRFGAAGAGSAMLFRGAVTAHPALRDPDYDCPDALIGTGAAILESAVRRATDRS